MRSLRLREVKGFAQSHTALKYEPESEPRSVRIQMPSSFDTTVLGAGGLLFSWAGLGRHEPMDGWGLLGLGAGSSRLPVLGGGSRLWNLMEGASFIHWGSGPMPCKEHWQLSERPPALEALCLGTLRIFISGSVCPLPFHYIWASEALKNFSDPPSTYDLQSYMGSGNLPFKALPGLAPNTSDSSLTPATSPAHVLHLVASQGSQPRGRWWPGT